MKKLYTVLICTTLCIILTGCGGKIATLQNLKSMAKMHGDCQILKETESENRNYILVYDETYDFTYEIESSMYSTGIDGTPIVQHAGVDDTYEKELRHTFFTIMNDELNEYADTHNCFYEISPYYDRISLYTKNSQTYQEDAMGFCNLVQSYNTNRELDDTVITIHSINEENIKKYQCQITLPKIQWKTQDEQQIEYFTKNAAYTYDSKAIFLRCETKTFADTGLTLDQVYSGPASWEDETLTFNSPDSPVIFYYFLIHGEEHYICNFHVKDPDHDDIAVWYSDCGTPREWTQTRQSEQWKKRHPLRSVIEEKLANYLLNKNK